MEITLVGVSESDKELAETLARENMANYYAQRGLIWQPELFLQSWPDTENYRIHWQRSLAGFVRFQAYSGILTIRDLQLYPDFRKQGIGTQALDVLENMARLRGCHLLRLSVFKENPACALYLRRGFSPVEEENAVLRLQKIIAT